MYAFYTDNSIIVALYPQELDGTLAKMRQAKLDITEEGILEDFLGFDIDIKTRWNHISYPTPPN